MRDERSFLEIYINLEMTSSIDTYLDTFSDLEKIIVLKLFFSTSATMSEISNIISKPNSTANYIIAKLIKEDIVEKKVSEKDKRVNNVTLTPKGTELALTLKANMNLRLGKFINTLKEYSKSNLIYDDFIQLERIFDLYFSFSDQD